MPFLLPATSITISVFCDRREAPEVVAEAPVVAAPAEPMDINQGIQMVLKKALAHDGLSRGLHEAARAIEKGQAQLCILADDCNNADYKKLIEALCAEHNVDLLSVPEAKLLGQWAGLCKIDPAGEARKVVGCSCAVVTDFGEETEGHALVKEYLKVCAASWGQGMRQCMGPWGSVTAMPYACMTGS